MLPFPLGVIVLLPAAAGVVWLDLVERLIATPWWLVFAGVPAGYVLVVISTVVTSRRGLRFAGRQLVATIAAPFTTRLPVTTVLRGVAVATGEKLLFRLLGLWLLGQGALGVVVTSVVFALAHLLGARPGRATATLVDAVLCGAALAAVYILTGGVLAAVVAHVVRNLSLDALRLAREVARSRAAAEEGEGSGGR